MKGSTKAMIAVIAVLVLALAGVLYVFVGSQYITK